MQPLGILDHYENFLTPICAYLKQYSRLSSHAICIRCACHQTTILLLNIRYHALSKCMLQKSINKKPNCTFESQIPNSAVRGIHPQNTDRPVWGSRLGFFLSSTVSDPKYAQRPVHPKMRQNNQKDKLSPESSRATYGTVRMASRVRGRGGVFNDSPISAIEITVCAKNSMLSASKKEACEGNMTDSPSISDRKICVLQHPKKPVDRPKAATRRRSLRDSCKQPISSFSNLDRLKGLGVLSNHPQDSIRGGEKPRPHKICRGNYGTHHPGDDDDRVLMLATWRRSAGQKPIAISEWGFLRIKITQIPKGCILAHLKML